MKNSVLEQIRRGFAANLPVAASVMAYGSVLGVLAAQKSIGWEQLLFMNLSIFAGSAQFVMVDMWTPPLPVVEIVAAVFIINLRYLLIGASLHPLFQGRGVNLSSHAVTDIFQGFLAENLHHGIEQAGLAHRFNEGVVNPDAFGFFNEFIPVVCRYHDDGNIPHFGFKAPYFPGGFNSIHARHHPVHDDKVMGGLGFG